MGYTAMLLAYGAARETEVPDTNPPNIGHCVNSDVDTGVKILYTEDVQMYKTPPKI
jgi:hypothetical protein